MVTMESPDPVDGSQIKDRGGSSSNKKKKNLTLGSFKSPFKFLGKTYCKGCRKKCSGEVLRVNDVYFHSNCFKCKGCSNSLSQGGFFTRDKVSYKWRHIWSRNRGSTSFQIFVTLCEKYFYSFLPDVYAGPWIRSLEYAPQLVNCFKGPSINDVRS